MRTSLARLAAMGAALLAGGTLAACYSSGTPVGPTGNNPNVIGTPNALVRFVHGSPNSGAVNLIIDGQPGGTIPYGFITPYVSIPAGTHVVIVQSTAPVPTFPQIIKSVTVLPNGKFSLVLGGKPVPPAIGTLTVFVFTDAKFNTPAGNAGLFFHNARNATVGAQTVTYDCLNCELTTAGSAASGATIGPQTLIPSPDYFFTVGGTVFFSPSQAPPNTPANPSNSIPLGANLNFDMFEVDCTASPSPNTSCNGTSAVIATFDQNG